MEFLNDSLSIFQKIIFMRVPPFHEFYQQKLGLVLILKPLLLTFIHFKMKVNHLISEMMRYAFNIFRDRFPKVEYLRLSFLFSLLNKVTSSFQTDPWL